MIYLLSCMEKVFPDNFNVLDTKLFILYLSLNSIKHLGFFRIAGFTLALFQFMFCHRDKYADKQIIVFNPLLSNHWSQISVNWIRKTMKKEPRRDVKVCQHWKSKRREFLAPFQIHSTDEFVSIVNAISCFFIQ